MNDVDDLISAALSARAATVTEADLRPAEPPTGQPERARPGWQAPLLAAAAVVVVAGGVTAIALSRPDGAPTPVDSKPAPSMTVPTPAVPTSAAVPSSTAPPSTARPSTAAHSTAPHSSAHNEPTPTRGRSSSSRSSGSGTSAVDPKVVRFDGVGAVELGMTRARVEGLGYSGRTLTDGCVELDRSGRPLVILDPGSDRVVAIRTFPLAGYRTADGIRVGSSLAAIRSTYPVREEHLDGSFGQGGDGVLVRGSGGWLGLGLQDGKVVSVTVGEKAFVTGAERGC